MADLSDDEREQLLKQFELQNSVEGRSQQNFSNYVEKGKPSETGKRMKEFINPYTPAGSAGRGLMSGALMGWQPQVAGALEQITPSALGGVSYSEGRDEAQRLNDLAYKQNPGSYAAGYGTGAVGTTALTGGLGELALGARGATAAANTAKAANTINVGSRAPGIGAAFKEGAKMAVNPKSAVGALNKGLQGAASVVGGAQNEVPTDNTKPNLPPGRENDIQAPISQGFSSLQQWLADAKEDDKRKRAMELQASPEGRAISNNS